MKTQLFISLLLLNSCISSDKIKSTGIKEIQFGTGGGFVGSTTSHSLDNNGGLILIGNQINPKKKLSGKVTEVIFTLANKLKSYRFNEPDNFYSFITIITANDTNRIVWGISSQTIDTTAIQLHRRLTSLTK